MFQIAQSHRIAVIRVRGADQGNLACISQDLATSSAYEVDCSNL